jgi:hypothetical protein
MRKTVFILILLLHTFLNGRSQFFYNNLNESKSLLSLRSDFQANSNNVPSQFISDYYNSKYLTPELRTSTSDRLSENNIFGYSFNTNLYYTIEDTIIKGIKFYVGLEFNNIFETKFRKEAFNLLFFGNSMYNNQNVILDGFRLNMLNYQQFKVGIYKSIIKNNKTHTFGGDFAYNKGQSNLEINAKNASIFTQKDDEYIDITLNLEYKASNNMSTGLMAINGNGAAIDLFYNYNDNKNNQFEVYFKNVGFIKWKSNSQINTVDSTSRFDGFYISDVLNFKTDDISKNIRDSLLRNAGVHENYNSYVSMVPLSFYISYKRTFIPKRLYLTASVTHMLFSVYKPEIFLKPTVQLNYKKTAFEISPLITYGGYGGLNGGLEFSVNVNNSFVFNLGTKYINSMSFQKKSCGFGGYFGIYKTI